MLDQVSWNTAKMDQAQSQVCHSRLMSLEETQRIQTLGSRRQRNGTGWSGGGSPSPGKESSAAAYGALLLLDPLSQRRESSVAVRFDQRGIPPRPTSMTTIGRKPLPSSLPDKELQRGAERGSLLFLCDFGRRRTLPQLFARRHHSTAAQLPEEAKQPVAERMVNWPPATALQVVPEKAEGSMLCTDLRETSLFGPGTRTVQNQ